MIEILVRLPVKSLIRFESVSKTWRHFLKTPNFKSMHHKFNLSTSASRLLMCSTPKSQDSENTRNIKIFSFLSNDRSTTVLSPHLQIQSDPKRRNSHVFLAPGSYNGIVCYHDQASQIYLTNPTTREFKHLPPSCLRFETGDFFQMGIGLGFDSKNIYDLKVIRMFTTSKNQTSVGELTSEAMKAEIFTLSSNSWKQLHWNLDDRLFFPPTTNGFFYADSFHFLAKRYENPEHTIVCCDIHTETFKTMDLPSPNAKVFFSYLRMFKGFLSVVCRCRATKFEETSIEIWVMKDYGVAESWTKLFKIEAPGGCVICFWTKDHDALLMYEEWMGKLVSCNLNTREFEPIEIDGYKYFSKFLVYQETLVSIM